MDSASDRAAVVSGGAGRHIRKRGNSRAIRDGAVAFSLAALCFFTNWVYFTGPAQYYRSGPISRALVAANLLNTAALGFAFWAGIVIVRRVRRPFVTVLAQWIFLGVLLVPVNAIRKHFLGQTVSTAGSLEVGLLEAAFAGAFFIAIVRWREDCVRAGKAAALILVPFAGLSTLQQVSMLATLHAHGDAPARSQPLDGALAQTPAARVVWVVFDEMDEELSFANRPAGLRLPELDRLRSESLFAASARPPAGITQMSMPALLSGDFISAIGYPSDAELSIRLARTGETMLWRRHPNVFDAARKRGIDAGVAGWYLPYCREFGSRLSACAWEQEENLQSLTVVESIPVLIRKALDEIPVARSLPVPGADRIQKEQAINTFMRFRETALNFATDRRLGFVLLHWPIPHPPGIYNRTAGAFDAGPLSDYIDNLALTDREVGELRRALERAGLWDGTTLLVTADHPWRPYIWRHTFGWTGEESALAGGPRVFVPFLLKLAGRSEAVRYSREFNTIVTGELLLAVLDGKIGTAQEASRWLDKNSPADRSLTVGASRSEQRPTTPDPASSSRSSSR